MEIFYLRLKILHTVIFLLAALLLGKLFFVQVLHGEAYREKGEAQYVSPISEQFDRGDIYFKRKNGTPLGAATLQSGFTVAINPRVLDNPREAYMHLAELISDLDKDSFFLKAGKKNDPYEEIAHRVERDAALAIRGLAIPGVAIYGEKWRFYPGETLAAHVLGFVGFKGNEYGGRYGVERYYNDTLRRTEKELYVNFFAEVFANIEQSIFYRNNREGDVVLYIEPDTQRFLEQTLKTVAETWNIDSGGAVVLSPKTGAILAMAAEPTFNPNTFQDVKDYTVFSNPIVENVYEMGSIVKPLTMAVGLDTGAVTAVSSYVDRGFVEFNNRHIENYDGKARGRVSMQEVLNQSLNTGAVHVMQEVGKERFADYFLRFGFGEETGIDLPNEVPGLVENLKSPREIEYATASFGQGIATTPIAMIRALASLGNGGVLTTPHVAERIQYTLGSERVVSYGGDERIIKEETAEEITRMLVKVVDDALLGGTVKLPRYSIAAKTGTAQIARPDGGGYYEDRFLHAFFGYFPAYDPQFLIFLYAENPKGVRYASETLTKPFMDITKFLINYYEIPPDR